MRLRWGSPALVPLHALENEYEYYKRVLSKGMSLQQSQAIHQVLDIGCRNWSYARCIADFFPNARLTGVEVDGGRRYWNFYRRMDLARSYAHQIKNERRDIEVFEEDFRNLNILLHPQNVLFCFFFPFVSDNPCLGWGLPTRFADFSSLLLHSQELAQISGSQPSWLSSHQGEWEAEEAERAYFQLGFQVRKTVLPMDPQLSTRVVPYDTWIFSSVDPFVVNS